MRVKNGELIGVCPHSDNDYYLAKGIGCAACDRARISSLEARLARVLLYHTQFSSMNGGGHVWSRSRAKPGGR